MAFSPDVSKSNNDDQSDIDDNLTATKDMFDTDTYNKTESTAENDELENLIPNDLFELYIDANFNQPVTNSSHSFSDINSTALNTPNIDEIVPSIQVEDFLKTLNPNAFDDNNINDASVCHINSNKKADEEFGDLHSTSTDVDNLEEVDMDMEVESSCQAPKHNEDQTLLSLDNKPYSDFSIELKGKGGLDMFVDTVVTSGSTSFLDHEYENVKCNDDKKVQKSVRFANATPTDNIENELQSIPTNNPTSEPKASPPKQRYKRRSIQVQIPVHFKSGYVLTPQNLIRDQRELRWPVSGRYVLSTL